MKISVYFSNRVGIRTCSDYSPFGVELAGRTVSGGYRFGFNSIEKDVELKGDGNSYDFGARMFDPRIGRWLSIDPKFKKFPALSNFSYAVNSPILFMDFQGEDPKAAILFYDGDIVAFNTHIESLTKAGYTIVRATSRKELLKVLGEYSCPESPIENLKLISHGSPGGPEMTFAGGGFWTESELLIRSQSLWIENKMIELAELRGIDLGDNLKIAAKADLYEEVKNLGVNIWSDQSLASEKIKDQAMEDYKAKKNIVTICDFVDAMDAKKIHFNSNWSAVLAGCNISGYYVLDKQEIFTTSFAKETGATTYGSQGQTGPELNTSIRVSNSDKSKRDLKGHFIKTTSNGKREIKSFKIDLAHPEK